MSYVEIAKSVIPAVAKGVANAARTPVMLKSKGPRTANIDHGASAFTPGGTAATSHTADNSVGVRVTEKNSPCMTQCGSGSSGGQRHIAYEPETTSSVRLRLASVTLVSLAFLEGVRAV